MQENEKAILASVNNLGNRTLSTHEKLLNSTAAPSEDGNPISLENENEIVVLMGAAPIRQSKNQSESSSDSVFESQTRRAFQQGNFSW